MLSTSWQRCVDRYQLDTDARLQVNSLTQRELKEHWEPFGEIQSLLMEEVYQVAEPLQAAGFGISFADMAGIVLHYQADDRSGNYHREERAGTLWTEGLTGTNGVGTCVIERRPVSVFKRQHFFRQFAHLSCCAAPVVGHDDEMLGVLNFSTGNPDVSEAAFCLARGLVSKVAERISGQLFRRHFHRHALLSAHGSAGPLLLAVDGEHNIVGANAFARQWLGLSGPVRQPRSLWELFERDDQFGQVGVSRRIRLRRDHEETEFKVDAVAPSPRIAPAVPLPAAPPPDAAAKPGPAAPIDAPSVEACLGSDPQMAGQLRLLRRIAGSRLPIMVLGETGVGKDTLARAFHRENNRRDKPFVAFNCAAVPESLIDSELFGYGSGAFTGARREGNPGRLVEADGGTLFLDEIGDMPLVLQTRLLRVLETGEVMPLGSGRPRQVDLQVIAATNHHLKNRIAAGAFRLDLYHRLAAVVVTLPPLRERGDFPGLVRRLFDQVRGERDLELSAGAMAALRAHPWPGNVRELKFVLQRAVLVSEDRLVTADDLLLEGAPMDTAAPAAGPSAPAAGTARGAVALAERRVIEDALTANGGDVTRSARALNISRATLYRKLRQHRIEMRDR